MHQYLLIKALFLFLIATHKMFFLLLCRIKPFPWLVRREADGVCLQKEHLLYHGSLVWVGGGFPGACSETSLACSGEGGWTLVTFPQALLSRVECHRGRLGVAPRSFVFVADCIRGCWQSCCWHPLRRGHLGTLTGESCCLRSHLCVPSGGLGPFPLSCPYIPCPGFLELPFSRAPQETWPGPGELLLTPHPKSFSSGLSIPPGALRGFGSWLCITS